MHMLRGAILLVGMTAARLGAQATVAAPAPPLVGAHDSAAGTAGTTGTTGTTALLTGTILRSDGTFAQGGTVVASRIEAGRHAESRTGVVDPSGRFVIDSLRAGTYDVAVNYGRSESVEVPTVSVSGATRRDIVLGAPAPEPTSPWTQRGLTLACLLMYAIALLCVRWNHIALSVHAMIERQIVSLRTRLITEVGDDKTAELNALRTVVDDLKKEWDVSSSRRPPFFEFFFWSRGRENATWVVIHEIERQLIAFLAPKEQVDVYLQWAEAELRTMNKKVADAMADAIALSLAAPRPTDATAALSHDRVRKALLARAVTMIYSDRDTSFSTLMEWQNKAGWLILAAIIIIAFLVLAAGHPVLFLAGAAGGFLSRLARALKREDVPLDYGASWTTLFLSPLLGALAGWFGIALIALAAMPSLQLLGPAFRVVNWDRPSEAPTLAVAFLLGFSERLFDAIVGAVERHAESDDASKRTTGAQTAVTSALKIERAQAVGAITGAITSAKSAPSSNGTAASAPSVAPTISGAELAPRSDESDRDLLVVTGTGFASAATVTVNGEAHDATIESSERITLPLGDAELLRIDAGGDYHIIVANPDGAVSDVYDFAWVSR